MAFAQRIMATLAKPFSIDGEILYVGVSIGVAVVDADGSSAEELLSDADYAMYLAKARRGSGRIQLFDRATRASARREVHTQTALARALDRNELVVFYQSILDTVSRRPVGVEALLRWQHPSQGLLLPEAFLELAEQTGLIVPIGAWVLSEACQQVRSWNESLSPDDRLSLSVNLSGRQLTEPDLTSQIEAALAAADIDPRSLKLSLEVTETLLPTDQGEARRRLSELHELGIELAIDDFGSGYSSLRYARELPVSLVKIDHSFVAGIGTDHQDEAIVTSVVDLAHRLGLRVIGEGVETRAQFDFLASVSCDQVQGYLFSHPQPAEAFEPFRVAVAS